LAAHRNAPDSKTAAHSLEQACEQYRQELRRFFERRAPRADRVDDLVQLVYLRLLRSPPVSLVNDPRQFMYRVAWNVLRDENQRAQRERETFSCDPEQLEGLANQVGSLWVDDSTEELVREQLDQALRQLPRACQVAFLRQYRDGRSYKEIAEELGVTSHAVKKYIMKALNHFRSHFNTPANGTPAGEHS
jgi:RNA polymerase sigma factor (sigma-70 family)